eukprot:1731954-Alexandrium_andersonii.AAC.1
MGPPSRAGRLEADLLLAAHRVAPCDSFCGGCWPVGPFGRPPSQTRMSRWFGLRLDATCWSI